MANKHMKMLNIAYYQRNENQNYNEYHHLTQVRMAIIKQSANSKCWRRCGEREPCCTAGRNVNSYSHYGRQYGDFLKKKKKTRTKTTNDQQSHS